MAVPIQNTLVTAIPTTSGFPIVSGYTNSNGQVIFALTPSVKYTLRFSGPAIGTVAGFIPANSTFTLYRVKNKGTLSLSISGQKLVGGNSIYAYHGSIPVKALKTFKSWRPGSLFKNATGVSTNLFMPQNDIEISYASAPPPVSFLTFDGYNGTYLNNTEKYDPVTNTWSSRAGDLLKRYGPMAAAVNSLFYVINGVTSTAYTSSNTRYDPAKNSWQKEAPNANAGKVYGLAGGAVNGIIYAAMGYSDGVQVSPKNNAYDPSTNTWSARASFNGLANRSSALYAPAASATGGVVWFYGGDAYRKNTFEAYTGDNFSYDPTTNVWTGHYTWDKVGGSFPGLGVIGTSLYAFGGNDTAGRLKNVSKWKINGPDSFTKLASMPTKEYGAYHIAANSKLYAVGGYSSAYISENQIYDPVTNTWSTGAALPYTAWGGAAQPF